MKFYVVLDHGDYSLPGRPVVIASSRGKARKAGLEYAEENDIDNPDKRFTIQNIVCDPLKKEIIWMVNELLGKADAYYKTKEVTHE